MGCNCSQDNEDQKKNQSRLNEPSIKSGKLPENCKKYQDSFQNLDQNHIKNKLTEKKDNFPHQKNQSIYGDQNSIQSSFLGVDLKNTQETNTCLQSENYQDFQTETENFSQTTSRKNTMYSSTRPELSFLKKSVSSDLNNLNLQPYQQQQQQERMVDLEVIEERNAAIHKHRDSENALSQDISTVSESVNNITECTVSLQNYLHLDIDPELIDCLSCSIKNIYYGVQTKSKWGKCSLIGHAFLILQVIKDDLTFFFKLHAVYEQQDGKIKVKFQKGKDNPSNYKFTFKPKIDVKVSHILEYSKIFWCKTDYNKIINSNNCFHFSQDIIEQFCAFKSQQQMEMYLKFISQFQIMIFNQEVKNMKQLNQYPEGFKETRRLQSIIQNDEGFSDINISIEGNNE